MAREVRYEERKQILNEDLSSGLDFEPSYVREYVVDNIVKRVLSYLIAWDESTGEPVKVRALADGSIKVTSRPVIFTSNVSYEVEVNGSSYVELDFGRHVSRVDIFNSDFDLEFSRSYDGITWQGSIKLVANMYYSFDAMTYKLRFKAVNEGDSGVIQVVGWW